MTRRRPCPAAALLALGALLGGCAVPGRINPSFSVSAGQADDALRAMEKTPVAPERPIVVLAGLFDPGIGSGGLADSLERSIGPDAEVLSVAFLGTGDFDACRARLIDAIEHRWPSDDPAATVEVDAVGISMGGLIARYAARPAVDGKRVRIRRLYTISTPHLGADMAFVPTLDRRIRDMRSGSAFLTLLNAQPAPTDPEIVAYVRLDDLIVGTRNAVPPGGSAWWVAPLLVEPSHLLAATDSRIRADIARRLRGEPPFAHLPPAPLSPLPAGSTAATERGAAP